MGARVLVIGHSFSTDTRIIHPWSYMHNSVLRDLNFPYPQPNNLWLLKVAGDGRGSCSSTGTTPCLDGMEGEFVLDV